MPDVSDFFRGYARDVGLNPSIGGADNVQDALAAVPGIVGTPTVRAFPFAHNTPNLLTGATIYVPTIGEILLDVWIEVDTAWDGTTPQADVSTFVGNDGGMFYGRINPVDVAVADTELPATGMLAETVHANQLSDVRSANLAAGSVGAQRQLPLKFTTVDPLKVCVSQDGTNTGADPGSTTGAGIVYLVTVIPLT